MLERKLQMKKKQLRQENEELRQRVVKLERENLGLRIANNELTKPSIWRSDTSSASDWLTPPFAITSQPYGIPTPPRFPTYEIDYSPENSKPTTCDPIDEYMNDMSAVDDQ